MVSKSKRWFRGVALAFCVLAACWIAANLDVVNAFRHMRYYGDAEKTVEKLRDIYYPDYTLSADEVESQLRADPGVSNVTRVLDGELLQDELVLFRVNTMYSVGLKKDGNVIWMVDGVRK